MATAIDRFIKTCDDSNIQECVERTDAVKYAIDSLSEGIPYTIQKNILSENIYIWNESFIDKVMQSLSTTIVQKFSLKEKDLFDRYRNFLIFNVTDVVDEDVQKLDEYLGNL